MSGQRESDISLGGKTNRDLKTLAGGRYRIISLAGRGGMSQVYHAYDTESDRDVAIKVLAIELSSEDNFLERFQRESDWMRDFDHPNILKAYDYGQEDDKVFLVMSYYGGGSLRDRLGQGRLGLEQVANYLKQIASGLEYAHSRNIIHRDIKPSNILLHHANNKLVISDFGIAKALSSANPARTATIMGTPLYMAPEQFLDRVDQRSDIYSLGVVLYQMLTGEVPFKGDGIGFKHLNDQIPPLSTWGLNYDVIIEQVVQKALAKRPEARFQTAAEFGTAFQTAVQFLIKNETLHALSADLLELAPPTWNSIEDDPAVLPGQASLSHIPIITPAQLNFPLNANTDRSNPGLEFETVPLSTLRPTMPLPITLPPKPQPLPTQPLPTNDYYPLFRSSEVVLAAVPLPEATYGTPKTQPNRFFMVMLVAGLLVLLVLLLVFMVVALPRLPDFTSNATPAGLSVGGLPANGVGQPVPVVGTPAHNTLVFTSQSADGTSNISLYDPQNGTVQALTTSGSDSLPVWSPNGSLIVFQTERERTGASLYGMSGNGSNQTLLVAGAMHPQFAHSSNRLVYVNVKENELYTVNLEAKPLAPVRLTFTSGKPKRGPSWSYDDGRVAFSMQDEHGVYQIYTMDVSKPVLPIQLTNFTEIDASWPSYSPDNKTLVFNSTERNKSSPFPLEIFTVGVDGKNLKSLAKQGHNSHPVWVHVKKGDRIYYNSAPVGGYARIWTMNPDGSGQQILINRKSDNMLDDFAPSIFAPD